MKQVLQGLADLHSQDIAHLGKFVTLFKHTALSHNSTTDIKADNVLVNAKKTDTEVRVDEVQISDLENAAYLPKGRCVKGMLPGNECWRSPEGHFRGELDKTSDMFSFGILVCDHEAYIKELAILTTIVYLCDDQTSPLRDRRRFQKAPKSRCDTFADPFAKTSLFFLGMNLALLDL